MKTKIHCNRCTNPIILELPDPMFFADETAVECPNCQTELAYVSKGGIPKYDVWLIRNSTSKIVQEPKLKIGLI